MSLICEVNSASNAREIAFRDFGLFSERMRMLPLCGAGTERALIRCVYVLLCRMIDLQRPIDLR